MTRDKLNSDWDKGTRLGYVSTVFHVYRGLIIAGESDQPISGTYYFQHYTMLAYVLVKVEVVLSMLTQMHCLSH